MPLYRFYYLNLDGHITEPPKVGDFPDDRAAIKAAETLVTDKAVEVWDGSRVVIRLEANPIILFDLGSGVGARGRSGRFTVSALRPPRVQRPFASSAWQGSP